MAARPRSPLPPPALPSRREILCRSALGIGGIAAALATILLLSSGLCVFVVLRFSQSKEAAFV